MIKLELTTLTQTELLQAALDGLEQQRSDIIRRMHWVQMQLNGDVKLSRFFSFGSGDVLQIPRPGNKPDARWLSRLKRADLRPDPGECTTVRGAKGGDRVSTKPKRQMSAAGRARIAAAQKKRWAAFKTFRKRSERLAKKGAK